MKIDYSKYDTAYLKENLNSIQRELRISIYRYDKENVRMYNEVIEGIEEELLKRGDYFKNKVEEME